VSKFLGRYDVAEPARPWYDRAKLADAIADGRTKVEEWSYEQDPHYYCHERPDLALLVEAADAAQTKDEQLRELLSYCRHSAENMNLDDLSDEFNPYDDVAYRLGQILDGEQ
jgi:hypothetical protein